MKIYITEVKNYEFKGYVYDEALSLEQVTKLGLSPDPDYTAQIPVEGHFSIEWDDDIAEPIIESCTILGIQIGHVKGFRTDSANYCNLDDKDTCRQGWEIHKAINTPCWYPMHAEIELDDNSYDFDDACDQLRDMDSGQWYEDHQAGMADYYYDMLMDK